MAVWQELLADDVGKMALVEQTRQIIGRVVEGGLTSRDMDRLFEEQGITPQEVEWLEQPRFDLRDRSVLQVVGEEIQQARQKAAASQDEIRGGVASDDGGGSGVENGKLVGNYADFQLCACEGAARTEVDRWLEAGALPYEVLRAMWPQVVLVSEAVYVDQRREFFHKGAMVEGLPIGEPHLWVVDASGEEFLCTLKGDDWPNGEVTRHQLERAYWLLNEQEIKEARKIIGQRVRSSASSFEDVWRWLEESKSEFQIGDHPYHRTLRQFASQFPDQGADLQVMLEAVKFWRSQRNLLGTALFRSAGERYVLAARQLMPAFIWQNEAQNRALAWMEATEADLWRRRAVVKSLGGDFSVIAHRPKPTAGGKGGFENGGMALSVVRLDYPYLEERFREGTFRTMLDLPHWSEVRKLLANHGGEEVLLTEGWIF